MSNAPTQNAGLSRRDILKAAILAPAIAAIPWYVEIPIQPRGMSVWWDIAKDGDNTVVSFLWDDGQYETWTITPTTPKVSGQE